MTMRKIKLSHDLHVPGWGTIEEGTAFKVDRFNKRFVYIELRPGVPLRLARKTDCTVVY